MAAVMSIDFETRSPLNLRQTGVYPYAEHPDTDVWCMAFKVDDQRTRLWSPFVPESNHNRVLFEQALREDPELRAWNSGFEHVVYREILAGRYGFPTVPTDQWVDTAAEAKALALPAALGNCAAVLRRAQQKDDEGHKLMMRMCRPRATGAWWYESTDGVAGPFATKGLAEDHRKEQGLKPKDVKLWQDENTLLWWDDPQMLNRLGRYCIDDVETEYAVAQVMRKLPAYERAVFQMTARMNDRGVRIDADLVEASIDIIAQATADANRRIRQLTNNKVRKVTQVAALLKWVQEQGVDVDNLKKDTVRDLLSDPELTGPVREALQLRQDTGKTSTGKLAKMLQCLAADGRAHGLLGYHVASTGRWAGRLVQPQNFPRPEINPEPLIPLVLDRNYAELEKHGPLAVIIASMLRSMLTATPGRVLMAADYSQIEARVLAWLAGQDDLVQLFAEGGKIYETMAAYIFGKDVEEISKDSFERQIGKNSVLGAGFQMGPDRFAEQVQEQTGIVLDRGGEWCDTCGEYVEEGNRCATVTKPDLAKQAIQGYRNLYSKIPQLWKDCENAARRAVLNPGEVYEVAGGRVAYQVRGQFLWCRLPSSRELAYARPEVKEKALPPPYEDIVKESVLYRGVDSLTKAWKTHYTYGGHLVENIVQATARDLMAGAMLRVERAGMDPVLTVHDEVVVEADDADRYEEFMALMNHTPTWATGLPVATEGWVGERYRK